MSAIAGQGTVYVLCVQLLVVASTIALGSSGLNVDYRSTPHSPLYSDLGRLTRAGGIVSFE